jgi:ribosome biogenesis protein ENP2
MKLTTHSSVPVYTISGSSTARPLPEWLVRKRKRSLKQDPEFANRIELLQDFEFEEASTCVRVSEDGNWAMSTGTYKPQIHAHYLPQLSLSFARHTDTLNHTFVLLSSDYTKSLHLQTDRHLEFQSPGGCYYKTRIPRYGRGLAYNRRSTEALVPAVGVNAEGSGEVYRLNLELGRFMKAYEVDVGGDDMTSAGGGSLQGGINTGSVNAVAIAEGSHNLMAFGTSIGTVEFWDPRSKSKAGILGLSPSPTFDGGISEITALQFNPLGLSLAAGDSDGLIHLYDLRSPIPLLKKDQGYGFPIKNLIFLDSGSSTRAQTPEAKILSADKRIIKIWDWKTGAPWTSVEPAVDLNHVEWCRDSGMLLTANEGRQQHSFFIPQLGPAPKWCSFLDNLVEELAEDPNDPSAFGSRKAGEIYDNYKFLALPQLRQLHIDHLIGQTSLLRPYMHGYFVSQKLYEEASLISNPNMWQEQRSKSIQAKIDLERESRIRGRKKVQVKVNRKLAEKLMEREEKHDRRNARRTRVNHADEEAGKTNAVVVSVPLEGDDKSSEKTSTPGLLGDPRFRELFEDEEFQIDEHSREFKALNASTKVEPARMPKGLTAAEEEEIDKDRESDSDTTNDTETSAPEPESSIEPHRRVRQSPAKPPPWKNSAKRPKMVVSTSSIRKPGQPKDRSFGSRASHLKGVQKHGRHNDNNVITTQVGEKEVTFTPVKKLHPRQSVPTVLEKEKPQRKDRRSASGNVFRGM